LISLNVKKEKIDLLSINNYVNERIFKEDGPDIDPETELEIVSGCASYLHALLTIERQMKQKMDQSSNIQEIFNITKQLHNSIENTVALIYDKCVKE